MTIIPYGTISIDATPDGATGVFDDIQSIQAKTVRVYNAGTYDVSVKFGSESEETNPMFLASKESLLICKGEGNNRVFASTSGGKSLVRVTAVEVQNNGGDAMGGLELVSVLKDAMGSQKMIDAAAKKIADAKAISEEKRQEALEAAQTIADAKKAVISLGSDIRQHEANVATHNADVVAFGKAADQTKAEIEGMRMAAKAEYDKQVAAIAQLQSKAEERHADADEREKNVDIRERAVKNGEAELSQKKAEHEQAAIALEADKKEHEAKAMELEETKKKLDAILRK